MEYRLLCVVGARPNFMKMAPIIRAFERQAAERALALSVHLVHTGQHYDAAMMQTFFEQLGLPEPEVDLGVGSGSHATQTAAVMARIEPELDRLAPHLVIVVGDVNSTLAAALVAAKKQIPVAHVEAGLRSCDWSMPEEINRVVTDRLSQLLYTSEKEAEDNLKGEGIDGERICFVGNVMIDALLQQLEHAPTAAQILGNNQSLGKNTPERYALVTLHRPSNVDELSVLTRLTHTLCTLAEQIPLVFPLHPRTRAKLEQFDLLHLLEKAQVILLAPLPYLSMLGLMRQATLVLTDSGGIQEETTVLGVPCLTLRENTERPITISEGTNRLVGTERDKILDAAQSVLDNQWHKQARIPQGWDGKAAERIASHALGWLEYHAAEHQNNSQKTRSADVSQRSLV